ncbi:unnamed protein product [Symbiodinium natans]|uniref:ASCH domain-containing protein n=1 Tax=Symbiodinium natans TaxID=878477 RepID=A0A812TTS6_9DINO|nr:unnamed protein product [Symbiodinium natans]
MAEIATRKRRPEHDAPAEEPRKRPRDAEWRGNAERQRERGEDRGELPIMRKYLEQIRRGQKTVEGRINSGQFRRYREGDMVTFINQNQRVPCRITGIQVYWSFKEMLEGEGVGNCLADVSDVDVGVDIYHRIPSFEQRARQSGILAIRLQKL